MTMREMEMTATVTFEEAMSENIETIADFLDGLRYQVEFRDNRMLHVLRGLFLARRRYQLERVLPGPH